MWSTIASQMNLINAFSKLSNKRSQMVWAFPWKTLIDLLMFLGKIGEVKKKKTTTVAMQKELKRKVHVEAVCLLLSFVGIYSLLMNGKHHRAPKGSFDPASSHLFWAFEVYPNWHFNLSPMMTVCRPRDAFRVSQWKDFLPTQSCSPRGKKKH